ncbi:MAG: hypothetical protein M3R00_05580 [Pseudomonadota bacterium]|nr:hypothetical protein [Pseudomonadota bacterium]
MMQSWVKEADDTLLKLIKLFKQHRISMRNENKFGETPIDLAPTLFAKKCLIEHGALTTEDNRYLTICYKCHRLELIPALITK